MWEPQPPGTLTASPGLLQEMFYLYIIGILLLLLFLYMDLSRMRICRLRCSVRRTISHVGRGFTVFACTLFWQWQGGIVTLLCANGFLGVLCKETRRASCGGYESSSVTLSVPKSLVISYFINRTSLS